jgi:DNA-directed RNA polymerase subunit beta'
MEKSSQPITNFEGLRISIASPEEMLSWSHGEILKPETINYRTQKPERDGLFCERIFGPIKDYECYCGKYKKIRYKGIICDKCGVEVTKSAVRRERMGHIDLAVPVTHIWYLRGVPSVLGLILDMSISDLEKIIYFASFIILEVNAEIKETALKQLLAEYNSIKSSFKKGQKSSQLQNIDNAYRQLRDEILTLKVKKVISEEKYHDLSMKYGQIIKVGIGAQAIYQLLTQIKIDQEITAIGEKIQGALGSQKRRLVKRLRLLTDLLHAKIKPIWLLLTRLPVVPPDLRPMVQLDGGRFAASDLNDLYRRVINRNNRLKRFIAQGVPEVICRNEKRMLQEAVDALIDNSARRGKAASTTGARALRSLSDILRGKQGRFRQNLLGKRVDYSGRSVIVIGPKLQLHQCGLPKIMALELFKTFVMSELIKEGYVHNVKNAIRLIDQGTPEVWDILERISSKYWVMLNRAPTLHRLGIQAFQPVLIEGKAIQIHPLVCYAFNADFDGDQMAVHIPLSKQAVEEASQIMRSSYNLLKPASGEPVVAPRLDIVLGCYYLTSQGEGLEGEGKAFGSKNEAILASQEGFVDVRAKIKVRFSKKEDGEKQLIETTVGRILFSNVLPKDMEFQNITQTSKTLKNLVKDVFKKYGQEVTAQFVDKLKDIGFEYAGKSGLTISLADISVPKEKRQILSSGDKKLEEIEKQYHRGLITEEEKRLKIVELWTAVKKDLENKMIKSFNKDNPVLMMMASGARGSLAQVTQLAGMKGLVVSPTGEIIEVPIRSNYKEGLSVLEYFISTHGSRKGKSDTALRTSESGYLTRRLVDVTQDMVISEEDCGTKDGRYLNREDSILFGERFAERVIGRIAQEDIKNPKTGKILVKKGDEIDEESAQAIDKSPIEKIFIRSVINCQNQWGVCQKCYGRDLSKGKPVKIGEAVGIMGAQSIGEPGTQLTMKTFHLGGILGEDITTGLTRVEELFEARPPRTPASMSEIDGVTSIHQSKGRRVIKVTSSKRPTEDINLPTGYKWTIKNGQSVKGRQAIATAMGKKAVRANIDGKISISGRHALVVSLELLSKSYFIPPSSSLLVEEREAVKIGQQLNSGHLDLTSALKLKGAEAVQKYIIQDVKTIYATQGQQINEKHIELVIRQMFSKVKITNPGGSSYLEGQIIDQTNLNLINEKLKKAGKKLMEAENIVLGITRVALKTDSFLSAASFQETTSVLMDAAIKGTVDYLNGLKENVIIGKLIPAGSSFRKPKKIEVEI